MAAFKGTDDFLLDAAGESPLAFALAIIACWASRGMPDIEFLGLRQHLGLFLPDVVLHTFRQHGEFCVAMVRRCLGIQFGYQQLKQFLASLARDLKEERVYLRAGETASLIYPKD